MGKGKGCSFEESGSQSTHQVCDFSGIPTSDLFLPVHWDICVQRTSYVVQLRFSAIPSFSAPSSFWVIAHIWRNLCVHLIRQFIGCMCMLSGFSRVRLFVTPMDYRPPGSSVHGDSPGKNIGVSCHVFLQGSSQPRDRTQFSCIAGRFFTI